MIAYRHQILYGIASALIVVVILAICVLFGPLLMVLISSLL